MRKRAGYIEKRSVLTGFTLALALCWLALQISALSNGALSDFHWMAFVPIAFAGLFAAMLVLRFLLRRHAAVVCRIMVVVCAAIGILIIFASLSAGSSIALALLLMICFFLPFVRALSDSKTDLDVFAVSVAVIIVLFLCYSWFLSPNIKAVPLHIALTLLLPAAALVTYRCSGALDRLDVPDDFSGAKKSTLWIAVAASWLGASVSAFMLARMLPAFGAYSGGVKLAGGIVSVFMIMLVVALRHRGHIWQILYTVFTSFSLGVLLRFASAGVKPAFFHFLPVMLLFTSGAGMLILFFSFCSRLASPINRPMACGVGYVASIPALGMAFVGIGGPIVLPEAFLSHAPIVASVLVIAAAPLLLKGIPAAGKELPEASAETQPQTPAVNEAPAEEEDIMDFGALTKQLTNAEKKVFELILSGYSNQQIADELYISINTVKFHIRNVLSKIGVQRKSELLAIYAKSKHDELAKSKQ